MKSNLLHSFLVAALVASIITPSIQAQNKFRVEQALDTLQRYGNQLSSKIDKVVQCLRGTVKCSKEEIKQTRIIAGSIAAALATLVLLGAGTGVAKKQKWWPFKKKADQEPTIQEPPSQKEQPAKPTPPEMTRAEKGVIATQELIKDLVEGKIHWGEAEKQQRNLESMGLFYRWTQYTDQFGVSYSLEDLIKEKKELR